MNDEELMRLWQRKITRRDALRIGGVSVAALGLAACGTGTSGTTSTTPVRGGTITIGQPYGLDAVTAFPRATNNNYRWALWDALTQIDQTGLVKPTLATSWQVSSDRLSMNISIRQGVKFHSGRTMAAQDVKAALDYALDPKTSAQSGTGLRRAGTTVTAVDSQTIRLNFTSPLPSALYLLADSPIVDMQSDLVKSPGGTGPFKFSAFVPGDHLQLVRNGSYWQPNLPYLDNVIVKVLPDLTTAFVALQAGTIDQAFGTPDQIKQAQTIKTLSVVQQASAGNYVIKFNVTDKPLDNKVVRQALSVAANRQRFVDTFLGGAGYPTNEIWPKNSVAYDPSIDNVTFDLTKAQALLQQAGVGSGLKVTLTTVRSLFANLADFAQVYQADLATIGVIATIRDLSTADYLAESNNSSWHGIYPDMYGGGASDPDVIWSTGVWRPTGNDTHFSSDQELQLIQQAAAEPDQTKRLALYKQIAQFIQDQAYIVPLANPAAVYILRTRVHGLTHNANTEAHYDATWVG